MLYEKESRVDCQSFPPPPPFCFCPSSVHMLTNSFRKSRRRQDYNSGCFPGAACANGAEFAYLTSVQVTWCIFFPSLYFVPVLPATVID